MFGIANQNRDVAACFVLALHGERVEVHIGTTEHGTSVPLGVHHQHSTEMTLKLDMVDDLRIQHDTRVLGGQGLTPREVAPAPLAVRRLRAARARMFGPPLERAQMRVSTPLTALMEPESPDTPKELWFPGIAVGDHRTERRQGLLPAHTRQVVSLGINPACLLRPLAAGRCLLHAEAIGTVVGAIKPGQGRACHAFFRGARTAVPETSEAIRLLPTFGDNTGLPHPGLGVGGGDHCRQGGFIERDESESPSGPARKGLCLIEAIAAEMTAGRVAWKEEQKP